MGLQMWKSRTAYVIRGFFLKRARTILINIPDTNTKIINTISMNAIAGLTNRSIHNGTVFKYFRGIELVNGKVEGSISNEFFPTNNGYGL